MDEGVVEELEQEGSQGSEESVSAPGLMEKHAGTPRVSMSNALARSAHGLTLHEKRLVALCISKLDSGRHWTPDKLNVRITAKQFMDVFDIPHDKHVYANLRAACELLEDRKIIFYDEKRGISHRMRWVGRASYADGEGWVELSFFHELAPHLFKLHKQFTTYHLRQASSLRSVYAWRLLELLMQFSSTRKLQIALPEFHHAMEAPESCRKSFKDLRRRILEPAIKELRDKESLQVQYEARKTGRKVTSLRLIFSYDPQLAMSL